MLTRAIGTTSRTDMTHDSTLLNQTASPEYGLLGVRLQ